MQHDSIADVNDSAESGKQISDNFRDVRESADQEAADIQQRRAEIEKQTATSLDHAAACKETFTDWETRLAKILGAIDGDGSALRIGGPESPADLQRSASIDNASAEWQVGKLRPCNTLLFFSGLA
jgi:hypothetical protein